MKFLLDHDVPIDVSYSLTELGHQTQVKRERGLSRFKAAARTAVSLLLAAAGPRGQAQGPQYDLLLRGGHVIDAKNGLSAVRDVAMKDGRVAAVAPKLDPAAALKVVDVTGLYVTPGLV